MVSAGTHVQWSKRKGVSTLTLMPKRPVRGGNTQKSVSLPTHLWEALDRVSEIQSAAYREMGGKSKYSVSDLVEDGVGMYIAALVEEFGPLPETAEEHKIFVKKLAAANRKSLLDQVSGRKPQ